MMKLALKGIDFGSIDLNSYTPDVVDNFCLWLTLSIGLANQDGGHLFQVGVCTVRWLEHHLPSDEIQTLRHLLLVENFNFESIKQKINEIITSSERSNWDDSVAVLSRYFAWEYEDYLP